MRELFRLRIQARASTIPDSSADHRVCMRAHDGMELSISPFGTVIEHPISPTTTQSQSQLDGPLMADSPARANIGAEAPSVILPVQTDFPAEVRVCTTPAFLKIIIRTQQAQMHLVAVSSHPWANAFKEKLELQAVLPNNFEELSAIADHNRRVCYWALERFICTPRASHHNTGQASEVPTTETPRPLVGL